MFGVAGERVRVYYAKDDFAAAAADDLIGGSPERIEAAGTWCAENADVVVAHSPTLMERWQRYNPVFVPNGVDPAAFAGVDDATPPADVSLPAPIATFIGHLSNRVDVALLEAIARRGFGLLLVGPRQPTFEIERIGSLLEQPNVAWVGERSYA